MTLHFWGLKLMLNPRFKGTPFEVEFFLQLNNQEPKQARKVKGKCYESRFDTQH